MTTGESYTPRKAGTNWVPYIVVAALVGGGLFFKSKQAKQANNPAAAPTTTTPELPIVKTVPVKLGSLTQTLEVTGTLRSNQNIDLGTKIIGRVSRVTVREGSRVRRGQLLMQLDDDDLRAQVDAARAGVRTAQVRLEQSNIGLPARIQQVGTNIEQAQTAVNSARARYQQALLNEPLKVRSVETAIQQAEAAYQQAQARYQQAQLSEPSKVAAAQVQVANSKEVVKTAQARLEQAKQTSEQTGQQVEADIKRSQAGVDAAKAALAEVQRGARDQQIAQAQAQVNLADAQLRNAETELNRAKILFEGGAAPKQNVDQAQTAYDVAKAQLDAAKQNLSLVKEGATTEQVRQAQEAVRQAEAAFATSQSGRLRIPIAQGEVTTALAALQQAQENQRAAEANLSVIGVSAQETRAAAEAVQQARGALESARAQRTQIPITRQETRVALQAVNEARSALDQAIANRSQVPMARQDVQAAQAAVQSAKAQLEQAQINLANAQIYSPVNGVVSQKLADIGQTVSPTQPIMNLIALDEVYFEAQVSETEIPQLRRGQSARVSIPAVSKQPIDATVTDIIPSADARSRQFRVRISIPRPPSELPVGAFARGTVTTQVFTNTMIVPASTIRSAEDGQSSVYVAVPETGDRAHIKEFPVKTGVTVGEKTQILGGISRGDLVVTGSPPVADKSKVRLQKS